MYLLYWSLVTMLSEKVIQWKPNCLSKAIPLSIRCSSFFRRRDLRVALHLHSKWAHVPNLWIFQEAVEFDTIRHQLVFGTKLTLTLLSNAPAKVSIYRNWIFLVYELNSLHVVRIWNKIALCIDCELWIFYVTLEIHLIFFENLTVCVFLLQKQPTLQLRHFLEIAKQ